MADARASFGAEFDAETYESHEALYDEATPNAVAITTPNTFHAPAAVAALERDIAVLVEKPLADTVESAARIKDAADASDAFCMVGFHNRFRNPVEVVKAYQEEGRFGRTRHVEANYVRRRGPRCR